MADITAGKGRAPKPFMVSDAEGTVAKDAVWHSNVGLAPALRAEGKTSAKREAEAREAKPAQVF